MKTIISDNSVQCVCGWNIILHDLKLRIYHCDQCGFTWTEQEQAIESLQKKIPGPEPARARSGAELQREQLEKLRYKEEYDRYFKEQKIKDEIDRFIRDRSENRKIEGW